MPAAGFLPSSLHLPGGPRVSASSNCLTEETKPPGPASWENKAGGIAISAALVFFSTWVQVQRQGEDGCTNTRTQVPLWTQACTQARTCTQVPTCAHRYPHMHTHMGTNACTQVSSHAHKHTRRYPYVHKHTHAGTHMHTGTYVHTSTHTQVPTRTQARTCTHSHISTHKYASRHTDSVLENMN